MSERRSEIYSQTTDEIRLAIQTTVAMLESHCSLYDNGNVEAALYISIDICKVVERALGARVIQNKTPFPTFACPSLDGNHMPEMKLVSFKPNRTGTIFLPIKNNFPLTWIPFKDWWNKDVIYRAGANEGHTELGVMSFNPAKIVQYEKRTTLTRERLITLTRNKLAAHIDKDIPTALHELRLGESIGVLFGGKDSPSPPLVTTPAQAMLRQIGYEFLLGFAKLANSEPPPS